MATLPALARNDKIPGSRYVSGRGAALGDAFITLADDAPSSLFYNPAGLARLKKPRLEVINVAAEGTQSFFSTFKLTKVTKVVSLTGYKSTILANPAKEIGVSGQLLPTFSFRSFGIGVLYNNSIWAKYRKDDGVIEYRTLYQIIPTIGFGLRLAQGIIRLGYSLQWVNQASGTVQVSDDATGLSYKNALAEGTALSHTAGFALTFPLRYIPQLAIVARNLGNARFSSTTLLKQAKNPTGAPADEPMSFDVGVGASPKLGSMAHVNWAVQGRDLLGASGYSIIQRVVVGAELSFRDFLFFRGGWGSAYFHGGVGLRRSKSQFNLTFYNEEIGTPSDSSKDTRIQFHYQSAIF